MCQRLPGREGMLIFFAVSKKYLPKFSDLPFGTSKQVS